MHHLKCRPWQFLRQLSPCFVAVALSLAPFTCAIHAQSLPMQATSSNTAKQSQGNESPAAAPPAQSDQTIPLAQIADRAEQLDHLLEEIKNSTDTQI